MLLTCVDLLGVVLDEDLEPLSDVLELGGRAALRRQLLTLCANVE